MGYNTSYQIVAPLGTAKLNVFLASNFAREPAVETLLKGDSLTSSRYLNEIDADFKLLTKDVREIMICVEGQGEEIGDLWRKWYLNGELIRYEKPKWMAPPKTGDNQCQ